MTYGKSKDLAKRTQTDKVLRDKGFKSASDPKYDGYQRDYINGLQVFLIKCLEEVVPILCLQINLLLNQIINLQMNFINRSLANSKEEKFIHLLETMLGVLI